MKCYLDYGATSAIRPDAVVEAVASFLRDCGATVGRGGYGPSVEAGRIAHRCRRSLMGLLGVSGDPGRIAFLPNATFAINTALWGILGEGDVVVVSQYDHNAVLRPVHQLARRRGVEVRMLSGCPSGEVDLAELEQIAAGAQMVVVNAVSNVLGTLLPVPEMARVAHEAGALVLVDAAQSAGHLPLEYERDGADLVAFTGHKGLLGPQGIGGIWVREGVEVTPLVAGGTGSASEDREMPVWMPDRLEAGTTNAPGIAGLLAGCQYLEETGVAEIRRQERHLKQILWDGLDALAGVTVVSPRSPEGVGIVTITVDGTDAGEFASRLDAEWGVMVRAGLHCAPEAHRILGTLETGAIRLSVGWASTEEDVGRAVDAVSQLLEHGVAPV